jgi:Tfp pilus assembly protein PilX
MSAHLASTDTSARTRQAQRGVVMWVALVVLIVMSLAGLAMLRQMGAGVSIAGNIAFKENATSSADAGTEVGRQWLVAQTCARASVPRTRRSRRSAARTSRTTSAARVAASATAPRRRAKSFVPISG